MAHTHDPSDDAAKKVLEQALAWTRSPLARPPWDFKADNVLARVEKDQHGSVIGLWAKVADFGRAHASACQLWREFHEVLAGHDAELGRSGFVVGAALFNAARAATGAARQRGLRRCVDVLGDAISSLESSNDLETTHEARLLAARACEEWMNTYPTSSTEHHQLERLAAAFRTQA